MVSNDILFFCFLFRAQSHLILNWRDSVLWRRLVEEMEEKQEPHSATPHEELISQTAG